MNMSKSVVAVVLGGIVGLSTLAIASEGEYYGRDLMTADERAEHQERMRNFKSEKEREAYRHEIHERMEKRAKQQGMYIEDEHGEYSRGYRSGDDDDHRKYRHK